MFFSHWTLSRERAWLRGVGLTSVEAVLLTRQSSPVDPQKALRAALIMWRDRVFNKYEKGAARCMRAAEQVHDAVLSLGFRNMAQAWLELGKKKLSHLGGGAPLRRQQSHCHAKSSRVTGRRRRPMKRHGKSPSKFAAKHRIRSHQPG